MNTQKGFSKLVTAVILLILLLIGIETGKAIIRPYNEGETNKKRAESYREEEEIIATKTTKALEQFCTLPKEKIPSIDVVSNSPFVVKLIENVKGYEYAPSTIARNEPVQMSEDGKNIVFEIDNTNGMDGSCSYTDSTCTKNIYIISNDIGSTQEPRLLYASINENGIEKWVYDSVNNFLYVKENDYNQVIEFDTTSEFFTKVDIVSGNVIYSKKIALNNISSVSNLTILSNGNIAELEASTGLLAYDKLHYRTTDTTTGTVERINLNGLSDRGGIGSPVLSVDGKYVAFTDGWLSEKGVKVLNIQEKKIEFEDSRMTDIVFLKWATPNVLSLLNNEGDLHKLLDIKDRVVLVCEN